MIGDFLKIAVCVVIVITSSSLSMLGVFEPMSIEESEWHVYTVDSEGNVGKWSSIATDSGNRPHIGYDDQTNGNLKYAHWTGREWSVIVVDSVDAPPYTAIALDSSDYPHISYIKLEAFHHFSLMYARWDGNDWQIETVDFVGTLGGYETSMALDSLDYPHISYYDCDNRDLKYAHKNETGWNVETVDSSGDVGRQSSIDIDSNGYPHISYKDRTRYDLKYARWNGTEWEIETVDSYGVVGSYTSIAIDSKNNPHIAYLDASPYSHLNHAYFDGTSWELGTVDSSRQVGFGASLALDSDDYSHISYVDNINNSLRYAGWTGSEWKVETVDIDGPGILTSVAIDSDDLPHISYLDGWNGDLKYATKAELQPTPPSITLDIDPDTLNLKSKGRWITAYLSTENASIYDVDISSILLQDTLIPERWNYQDDVLMLKFNREEFKNTIVVADSIEVKISGKWEDGSEFEAYDHIRVIDPGKG